MAAMGPDITVTLADVARRAGVSLATASKALNGKEHVAAPTREKVLQAAKDLSYVANTVARNMAGGRTGTVGLIAHDESGRFILPLLKGAEDGFGQDVAVFLCDAHLDEARERHYVKVLLERRIDGLLIMDRSTNLRESLGPELPVPVVYAYGPSDSPDDCSIVPDGVEAGRLAAQHLLAVGRRRIAVVMGIHSYTASHDRAQGELEVLGEAGLDIVGGSVLFGSWTESWGRTAMLDLLQADPNLDGVICGSDTIARGVLDTLRDAKRLVPFDVSVIGHDNWEQLAIQARPPLTTIDMQLEHIGRMAALRLSEAMEGNPRSGIEMVKPRLVVRGSTIP